MDQTVAAVLKVNKLTLNGYTFKQPGTTEVVCVDDVTIIDGWVELRGHREDATETTVRIASRTFALGPESFFPGLFIAGETTAASLILTPPATS